MDDYKPGTIAVNWEKRELRIRSYAADYWHDSRFPRLGRILLRDESVASRYEIIQLPVTSVP